MAYPLTYWTNTFTGSNGAAWPSSDGSGIGWTDLTESGTWSVGPSETIQSNTGRAGGTASAVGVRRHIQMGTYSVWDPTTFVQETRASFVRSTLNVKPGVTFEATSPTATTSGFILAQADTIVSKSTYYTINLQAKDPAGVYYTLLSPLYNVASTTATRYTIAMRGRRLANGNTLIQAKMWTGSEPAWVWPATDVTGATNQAGSTGSYVSLAYVMSASLFSSVSISNPRLGLYEETDSAVAYTVDWDDLTSIWPAQVPTNISTNFGGLTATATATVTSGSSPQSISLAPSAVTATAQAYGLSLSGSTGLSPSVVSVDSQAYGLSKATSVGATPSTVTVDPLSLTSTFEGASLPMAPSVLTLVPSVMAKLAWPPGGGFVTVTFSPLEEGSIDYSFPESGDTITVSISRSS
jgi:hypothetical protein